VSVLRRTIRYVLRFKGMLFLSVLFSLVYAFMNVMLASVFEPLVQSFKEKRPPSIVISEDIPLVNVLARRVNALLMPLARNDAWLTLVVIGGFTILVALALSVSRFLQEYFTGYISTNSRRMLGDDLDSAALGCSVAYYGAEGTTDAMSRFTNDLENMGAGIKTLFGNVIREPLTVVLLLAVCLIKSWRLALVTLAVFPVTALFIYVFGRKVRKATRRSLKARSNILVVLREAFSGIRIVKVFRAEDYEKGRFREANRQLASQRMRIVLVESATRPLLQFTTQAAIVVTMVLAGYYIHRTGTLTFAQFFAFYATLLLALGSLRKLGNFNNRMNMLMASGKRVFQYMDVKPTIVDRPGAEALPPFERSIRFEGVSFAYDPNAPVLENLSFEALPGEVVAISGRSGIGKTTLVSLIPRFYDSTSGRITIDGRDIREVTLRSLRAQIGMVTQETVLFDDTVTRNIAYGDPAPDLARVREAARRANASGFVEELPQGYDTVIGEMGNLLSGGQRQRLAIARALYKDAPILILDEATSALDRESERLVQEALEELERGRTTFVIAHRETTIERADKTVVLTEDGHCFLGEGDSR
jgi:subfamily B ATP-binding cassette protein MsbA